jgi:hypothetical protein
LTGFENLNSANQQKTWEKLQQLVEQRSGPLRVDCETSSDSARTLVYVRERGWGEFFTEMLVFPLMEVFVGRDLLVERENHARAAIAHALDPYFNKRMMAFERSQMAAPDPSAYYHIGKGARSDSEEHTEDRDSGVEPEAESDSAVAYQADSFADDVDYEVARNEIRIERLQLQRLQAAVLENSPPILRVEHKTAAMNGVDFTRQVELMPVHGLRKCPPGLSVVPFSPLTLICNNLFVSRDLNKSSPYCSGKAFERVSRAFESALKQHEPQDTNKAVSEAENAILLTPTGSLPHVENLWLISDFVQWGENERDKANVDDWTDFYLNIFRNAEEANCYGSTVLEPCPSFFWDLDGVRKPTWTDENIEGLAIAALSMREGCLKVGESFQSITLAITDTTLRNRVEQKLIEMEEALFTPSQASSSQIVQNRVTSPGAHSRGFPAGNSSTSLTVTIQKNAPLPTPAPTSESVTEDGTYSTPSEFASENASEENSSNASDDASEDSR